jgi:hypothetical protein
MVSLAGVRRGWFWLLRNTLNRATTRVARAANLVLRLLRRHDFRLLRVAGTMRGPVGWDVRG